MVYRGSFKDVIYPAPDREPRAARYRIILLGESIPESVRAIVHLIQDVTWSPDDSEQNQSLDVLLNRIVSQELDGIRLDHIQLVAQSGSRFIEYPLDFDAVDYHRQGNPVRMSGFGKSSAIHINLRDVTGGSVALFVDRDGARAASAALEQALR